VMRVFYACNAIFLISQAPYPVFHRETAKRPTRRFTVKQPGTLPSVSP